MNYNYLFLPILTVAAFLIFKAQGAEKLSLDGFLKAVKSSNLDLRSQDFAYKSVLSGSKGLNIPAPMVGFMQMQEGNSRPASGFEISQEIPFPTKLTHELKARESEERFEHYNLLSKRNEILAEARLVYYQFWQSFEEKKLLTEKKAVLQRHISLTQSKVRSDSVMALHLIDAESDLDLLENELIDADRKIAEAKYKIASLQGLNSLENDIEPLEPPLSEIRKKDTTVSPQTMAAESLANVSKEKEWEAKASRYPDFNVRFRSLQKTDMSPASQEYMVGLTLPFIFFGKPNADIGKASATRQKAEADFEKAQLEEKVALLTFQNRADSLLKQIQNLDQSVIPRAEKRMRLVHNLIPRDMESLQDHRRATESIVDLKFKRLNLRAQYEEVVTALNRYVGEDSL